MLAEEEEEAALDEMLKEEARKEEARKKLQMPIEYQGDLIRYTWTLCLTDSVDRDQLRARALLSFGKPIQAKIDRQGHFGKVGKP